MVARKKNSKPTCLPVGHDDEEVVIVILILIVAIAAAVIDCLLLHSSLLLLIRRALGLLQCHLFEEVVPSIVHGRETCHFIRVQGMRLV